MLGRSDRFVSLRVITEFVSIFMFLALIETKTKNIIQLYKINLVEAKPFFINKLTFWFFWVRL